MFPYYIGISILIGIMRLMAFFGNKKIQLGLQGRKNQWKELENIPGGVKIIWLHTASLGEYQQVKTLIEKLKTDYDGYRILLTFFSPSGYVKLKKASVADYVFYLPFDKPKAIRKFLSHIRPVLVIFVKYEFWLGIISAVAQRKIPLLLVSAVFQSRSVPFRWYGYFARKALRKFDVIFVQNNLSKTLLAHFYNADNICVVGDTRIDSVINLPLKILPDLDWVSTFKGDKLLFVCGSTWFTDHKMLCKGYKKLANSLFKYLIVPHELRIKEMRKITCNFPNAKLFSEIRNKEEYKKLDTIVLDVVGWLAYLYRFADWVYIGGGWRSKGLHNTLEPAVYGKPIIIGKYFDTFQEAMEMVKQGGMIALFSFSEYVKTVQVLLQNEEWRKSVGFKARQYITTHTGATNIILQYLYEKRLLSNCKNRMTVSDSRFHS